jgi:8-oxo-dGTP pyrophosphatase MutT (NUDIX family)
VEREPDCFERHLAQGHLTGSAWIINRAGTHTLLTHHRKLDLWLQLGGHADGDTDIHRVALKEAREESGLDGFEFVDREIFDLDIHRIPARKQDPEHWHYDTRFLLRTSADEDFSVSEESHDLAWVPAGELENFTTEHSMLRMRDKWLAELRKKL